MKVIHIDNPQVVQDIPAHHMGVENWGRNATTEQILAAGFRPYFAAMPTDGYRIVASHIEHDAVSAWQVIDAEADIAAEQAAQQAAEDAAEALRLETPLVFDQPIKARVEVPVDPDHYYRLEIDFETGEAYGVEIESTRLTPAEYAIARAAAKAARKAARDAVKAELDGLKAKASKLESDLTAASAEIEKLKKK